MSSSDSSTKMSYRFLGNSGLLVSKLSLGAWMQYKEENTVDAWYEMMKTAFKHGVNFFDTSEMYANGHAEKLQGGAVNKGIIQGVWSREDLDQTTKGSVVEGTKASLRRMELDYVDVLFCHRPDPHTPIEETVRAMNYVIEQGWAFYWGTSEWLPSDFIEACEIADRLGLIRPIVEQAQYNILHRSRVEFNYVDLYKKYKLGLTTWSPLAYGTLTGKYSSGTPEGSRYTSPMYQEGALRNNFEQRIATADKLKPIAAEIGCSLAQMAIAWVVSNENVSTALVGASRPSQLEENLKALEFVDKITPEVKAQIDDIVNFVPTAATMDTFAYVRERHL
ncbi:hypothetical protein L916_03168 [Phytophthora nicotianae]|uniref:NADP-dependent oxidoreductase domain-containing protein n=1 Tax=Phytophthora nicotianae TaxID=4792 RepID=W2JKX9_PHYNI|nr:hypothetical protein L916_03168 [Phytophthora nicotianae]